MKLITSILLAAFMTGCSFSVVPPAHKGKVLKTSGYSIDVLEPGKYTLWGRDALVLLETSTGTYKEIVTVIMADKLTLTADVRFRGRINGSKDTINSMFNDMKSDGDGVVSFMDVYGVYGRMAVRNKAREVLSQYTVEDVHKNYGRLSKEIGVALLESFKSTPLQISDVALGDIKYPDVVTKAVEVAKARELDIKREQAQAEIDLTKKKNEQLLAEANYKIEITKAKATRDANKIIGEGITSQLLQLRSLEVQETMSKNLAKGSGSTVFMPFDAINTVGGNVRMFSK